MKIMMIGDVISTSGCEYVEKNLSKIKREQDIDMVIANGENSAEGNGVTKQSLEILFDSGVDVITTGNHSFKKQNSDILYDNHNLSLIRPANYPEGVAGRGYVTHYFGKYSVCVINLMGTSYMESIDNPFTVIDEILEKEKASYIIVDLHAEATGEKKALAYYLDGRVSAVLGTHTHVQTADAQILPQGTMYISDVGMTGAVNSVLGIEPQGIIRKLKYKLPTKFEVAKGDIAMDYVVMDFDNKTIDNYRYDK